MYHTSIAQDPKCFFLLTALPAYTAQRSSRMCAEPSTVGVGAAGAALMRRWTIAALADLRAHAHGLLELPVSLTSCILWNT